MSIDKSKAKIDKVFDKVKEQGLTFGNHHRKKQLADRTVETYRNVVQAYANYLYREHGVYDIARAKPRYAYDFIDKQIKEYKCNDPTVSAYTMRRFAHALHSFYEASKVTGVFRGNVKVGDKREILKRITAAGIFRKSIDSKTLKASHSDYAKVQSEILKLRSPNTDVISKIHQTQRYLGARITEAISLKKSDLTYLDDGSLLVRIKGKGGLVRFVTTKHKDTICMLENQVMGKKEGAPVFQVKNTYQQDKSIRHSKKLVEENIRKAALNANVDRGGKKYTSHSARKAYAQYQMDNYCNMTKHQLKQEVAAKINLDPYLKVKFNTTIKNIRAKVKSEIRTKRRLTHKELCLWLTSVDLGHGRIDVVRYYADYHF
ncbi:site-specific integrase [Bacillus sp. FJAT-45350]|uniref:site-specific integrase n=1 Tax=Bacillus sp. FJAT-45350 TaxID=2011014 RepID=UPI000BB8302E|nr:site-specific integrase [Bacillus sp. FJAT-45350]